MNGNNLSIKDNSSHIIFITGGTKSGKSEFAEHLAKQKKNITYVALSENNSRDKGWQRKINIHKKRRPKDWKLIETHIEDYLRDYTKVISVTPISCKTCGRFLEYSTEIDVDKTLGYYEKSD